MIDLVADISKFNASMARFADEMGLTGGPHIQRFIAKQCIELTEELIKVSPPKEPAKTRQQIEDHVKRQFGLLARDERFSDLYALFETSGGKVGSGEVAWFLWTPDRLFGVKREADMRKASADELYALRKTLTGAGPKKQTISQKVGKRGKQTVYIRQKILTLESTVKKVIARIKRHVGRLKAGWLPSYRALRAIVGSGPVNIPQMVLRHEDGARGYCDISGLGVPNQPTVTLVNFARGCSSDLMQFSAHRALRGRSVKMIKDLQLYLKGVKKRADLESFLGI